MSLELALNLVLAVLLVAVIVYAMRLHKRLGAWRDGKAELDRAATQFAKAAERAEAAVAELKMASEASGRLLEDQTRTALALKDDLEMLVARAAPAADELLDRLQARPATAPVAVAMPRLRPPLRLRRSSARKNVRRCARWQSRNCCARLPTVARARPRRHKLERAAHEDFRTYPAAAGSHSRRRADAGLAARQSRQCGGPAIAEPAACVHPRRTRTGSARRPAGDDAARAVRPSPIYARSAGR